MIAVVVNRLKMEGRLLLPLILVTYVLLTAQVLGHYLDFISLSFIAGSVTLVTTARKFTGKTSNRYVIACVCFLLLTWIMPVKTLFYFSIGFAVFFLVESLKFRLSFSSVIALLLMAPVSEYAANTFSFPVRLQLSSVAGEILSAISKGSHSAGNVIYHNGNEFSVDPACMGLNMLIASLLTGLMVLSFYEQQKQKQLKPVLIILFLMAVIMLNLFSNVSRIILLVLFSIPAENILHEITGLVCVIFYVMLPSAVIARKMITRYGRPYHDTVQTDNNSANKMLHVIVCLGVCTSALYVTRSDTYKQFGNLSMSKVNGYNVSVYAPGIAKLENKNALVYVKFIRGFYDSDHSPTICWKGSGYNFTHIRQQNISGCILYTAILQKGKDHLSTAWWYSNGSKHTSSAFSWRLDMMKGARNYAVVNVTASSESDLIKEVNHVIHDNSLNNLFSRK
jgi:exosortase N